MQYRKRLKFRVSTTHANLNSLSTHAASLTTRGFHLYMNMFENEVANVGEVLVVVLFRVTILQLGRQRAVRIPQGCSSLCFGKSKEMGNSYSYSYVKIGMMEH